jgi:hypothetical protein
VDAKLLIQTMRDQLIVIKETTELDVANDERFKNKPGYKRIQDEDTFDANNLQFIGAKITEPVLMDAGFTTEFVETAQPHAFDVTDTDGNVFGVVVERINWKDDPTSVRVDTPEQKKLIEMAALVFQRAILNDQDLIQLSNKYAESVSGQDGNDEDDAESHLIYWAMKSEMLRRALEQALTK